MQTISLSDVSLNCLVQGDGPPLLLIHGFPVDHTMWKYQIEALASVTRVIAPDLRGFGGSGVSEGTVSMERFADDLHQLLAGLGVTDKITFCGLSMGGYIGWQFSRKYQDKLARLIVCDSRSLPDTAEAARARRITAETVLDQGPSQLVKTMTERLFAPTNKEQRSDDVEAMRQVMLSSPPQGIAAALRGMAERPDATDWLPAIRVPTLVLVGEHDQITPPEEMRHVAAAIPGARFVEVPEAGHMAPLENPKAVNAAVREFLR